MTDATASPREYLAHLYRVSQIFSLSLDFDDVLRRVMDEVVAATQAERGFLLLRAQNGQLRVRAARGKNQQPIDAPEAQLSQDIVERVVREGQPLLTMDAQDESWLRQRESTTALSLRSILCAPLQAKDETLGVIYVDNRMRSGAFSNDDLELLVALAYQSAIAIENARLFRDTHAQLQLLALLHDITADLTSTLDLQRVLTACLERVQGLMGTVTASVLMVEGDELVFQIAIGEKANEVKPFRIAKTMGIAGWVVQNATGTFSNDVQHDSRFYANVDKQTGFVTQMLMAAPLVANNRVLGVLEVSNKPGGFNEADLTLFSTIAASAAIAIENARLYQVAVEKGRMERELQVAREVQANLIPRTTPRIAGWEFAAQWHSALEVSGDFYDFVVTDGAPLGIVIGDVADKGMPAALFMALTRTILRASVGYGRTAAQILARANRLVCADATNGMFVTLCYAELDPVTGELCYANAGHPAPLWYRAARDELIELTRHGLPLGIVDEWIYEHESAQLERGDVVLFYTDGVTDALNSAGEDFGKPRLLRVVADSCRASASDVHGDLQRALVEFIGATPPADDATFVVVRRTN